ncbi:hypothetical protein [Paenibacillus thiaminolyticus]|uniref:Uncharacterized protein n=1 Tax=Paenibacillus thiaminolyticus TaxID=49283 RepID=A0A3A3GIQ4_PANTH|nr:hypothetical protein [Paenibacillus thiaminolyticus]RJG23295.1 hypothetical protein DQX05_13680 [Paenibacillus thiaminolyticus]RJG23312.1 hypothetical protein DQX05_13770 [Paenibacillus thiaminolyticus]
MKYDGVLLQKIQDIFLVCVERWNQTEFGSDLNAEYDSMIAEIKKLKKGMVRNLKPENFKLRAQAVVDRFDLVESTLKKETEIKKEIKEEKEKENLKQNDLLESDKKKKTKNKNTGRGGARVGAGRPSLGVKKPVSITLPSDDWEEIDNLIQRKEFKSYADYFRFLHHVRWREEATDEPEA